MNEPLLTNPRPGRPPSPRQAPDSTNNGAMETAENTKLSTRLSVFWRTIIGDRGHAFSASISPRRRS